MQAKFEPFRIGSKLSQSGKHKKPRRESRLFSFKYRVLWGFLLTADPSYSSLSVRSASSIARFLVPTPSRIAKSLGLSRLTATGGLTELGSVESLLVAVGREFEIACPTVRLIGAPRWFEQFPPARLRVRTVIGRSASTERPWREPKWHPSQIYLRKKGDARPIAHCENCRLGACTAYDHGLRWFTD